ncbi:MAG: HEAT repeat domain-containing protein [Candidatus Binataceae bacterium]
MTTQDRRVLDDYLKGSDRDAQIGALIRLASDPHAVLTDAELDAVLECLGSDCKAVQRRASDALVARASHDVRVKGAVRKLLTSASPHARWGGAYALGTIGGDAFDLSALAALLEALDAGDGDLRWAAAQRIVELGGKYREEVCDALIALEGRGAVAARKMALYCLRDLGAAHENVRALAERAATASEVHLRLAALSLLGSLGDGGARSAETIVQRLEEDSDAGVRRSAAATLGRLAIRSPRVLSALRLAAGNVDDESLRRSALAALKRLGEQ